MKTFSDTPLEVIIIIIIIRFIESERVLVEYTGHNLQWYKITVQSAVSSRQWGRGQWGLNLLIKVRTTISCLNTGLLRCWAACWRGLWVSKAGVRMPGQHTDGPVMWCEVWCSDDTASAGTHCLIMALWLPELQMMVHEDWSCTITDKAPTRDYIGDRRL